jgi:hypothetical protein
VTGGSLVGEFFGADSDNTLIVARSLTTSGRLRLQNGATLVVNENLTMGSEQAAEITAGSIQVDAGKTFTHY